MAEIAWVKPAFAAAPVGAYCYRSRSWALADHGINSQSRRNQSMTNLPGKVGLSHWNTNAINLREGVFSPNFCDPALNPLYLDVPAHYGVTARSCKVRDPDRKDKIESGWPMCRRHR